ncbi:copper resistance CopC family protein [Actinoplanes sp. N902-109]|uniref:copper resistance CopC family protein n=1 Tax=Actinoplanes sp. (strain N902-109) TaxID=649831 RepID=UPI0003295BB8|nr:copper resistance CopC family protein [Actinoplanes sp. N902-109]AGL16742.1 cell wall anchor domain-containing protein [Actinoplanes sp. N902-109]
MNRVKALAVLAGTLVLVLFLWRPGGASPRLTGVSPADGTRLGSPPAQVVLTFSGPPVTRFVHVVVTGADRRTVPGGEPVVTGDRIVAPLAAIGSGAYRVSYHVELDDGSQLTGDTGFVVGAGAEPVPAATTGHVHLSKDPLSLLLVLLDLALTVVLVTAMLRRPRRPTGRSG